MRSKLRERYAQDNDYRGAVNSRNREAYQKRMLAINAKITDALGGTCSRCGKSAPGMKIRTNSEACKSAGHERLRNSYMQWYVDNPAEAGKFLLLFWSECGRAAQGEASRKFLTGRKLSAEHRAKKAGPAKGAGTRPLRGQRCQLPKRGTASRRLRGPRCRPSGRGAGTRRKLGPRCPRLRRNA